MPIRRTVRVLKNNIIVKSKRKTMYDHSNSPSKGTFGELEDHTQMKSHEFANFQKEQFLKKKQDRSRERKLRILAVVITLLIILLFLLFLGCRIDISYSKK
jgi:uncharacterized membrane protein